MKVTKLGICIADEEYGRRLVLYLMNHYADKIAPEVFSAEVFLADPLSLAGLSAEMLLKEAFSSVDALLLEGVEPEGLYRQAGEQIRIPMFCLKENAESGGEKEVVYMEKYQDVNHIVEQILEQIGQEVEMLKSGNPVPGSMLIYGVYGLGVNSCQMPFAVTLAEILGERKRVLLLDLQENSGLLQLTDGKGEAGLEELLLMTESGRYSRPRMKACIGRWGNLDYVYPARNTENICEVREGTVEAVLGLIDREMDYEVMILNFGARFCGFFDTMQRCHKIFLLSGNAWPGGWREAEFLQEIRMRKMQRLEDNMIRTEVPSWTGSSCGRLIEQWKWNEVGDKIRRIAAG